MCDCIDTTNALLRDRNAVLVTTLFGKPPRVVIATCKHQEKVRGKPPAMLASFCPFCGEAYAEPELAATLAKPRSEII